MILLRHITAAAAVSTIFAAMPGLCHLTTVSGISNNGLYVAGEFVDSLGRQQGFIDAGGVFTTIADPNDPYDSEASGVNNSDVVVGSYVTSARVEIGFVDVGGVFTSIVPTGSVNTSVNAINDSGAIVGDYFDHSGHDNGFIDTSGVITTIDVPGAKNTAVLGIDDDGEVVGDYSNGGATKGFVDIGGVFTTVSVPGAADTNVSGINDSGEIAGTAYDSFSGDHGFTELGGVMTPVNEPNATDGTSLGALNNAGTVVGTFYFSTQGGSSTEDGFVYQNGKFTVIDDPRGASPEVPEPSVWTLMIAGLGLTGAALRRRRPWDGLKMPYRWLWTCQVDGKFGPLAGRISPSRFGPGSASDSTLTSQVRN